MARRLRTLVNIHTRLSRIDKSRITFANCLVIIRDAISISTVDIIARTLTLVEIQVTVFIARTVGVGKTLDLETTIHIANITRFAFAVRSMIVR